MRLVCDGCKAVLEEADKVKVTELAHQRWVWRDKFKDHHEWVPIPGRADGRKQQQKVKGTGVMEIERAYRPAQHYCASCADMGVK